MNTPIFVASRGRTLNASFLKLANEGSFANVIVVVEPREYPIYRQMFANLRLMELPANDRGLAYARNFVKSTAEQMALDRHWVLDDDISGFYYRVGTKLIKEDCLTVLAKAEEQFLKVGAAFAGLEYRQLAWTATQPFIQPTFVDVVHFVNNTKTAGLRYDETLPAKIDRDFAMQVIKQGGISGRTTVYAFSAPPNGSNAGGLKDIMYDIPDREKSACDAMVQKWGDNIVQRIVKKDGRDDIKIHWNKIVGAQQASLF